jgi:lysyl-tRNA synthetase class 2
VQWRPTADIGAIRQRAELLAQLREFFRERSILEVETPLLCKYGITDPSIEPYIVPGDGEEGFPKFLQTSPEYAMKRLLAALGEPIFQISKAFRHGEAGSRHNPEFSLLEWYRPGFDHHQLMDEVAALVSCCLDQRPLQKYRYRDLFLQQLQIDPFTAPLAELEVAARRHLDPGDMSGDRDCWLDLLMSHVLGPQLGIESFCFVYDYPASQAALARIVPVDDVSVGQRFELYVDGVELANGYCELTDADEQRQRFEEDNALRQKRNQPERPVDELLLAALDHGLPDCSGVALGVDRLLMLSAKKSDIRDVLAFGWERA